MGCEGIMVTNAAAMKPHSCFSFAHVVMGLALVVSFEAKAENIFEAFGGNGSFELGPDGSLYACNQFTDATCSLNNGNHSDSGDRLPGWLAYYDDNGGGESVLRSPLAQDGERMLYLTYAGTSNMRWGRGYVNSSMDPVLTVGQTYELSFWAAAAQPDRTWNGEIWQNQVGVYMPEIFGSLGKQTFILPAFSGDPNLSTRTDPLDWQHYTIDFVAASETLYLSIAGGGYERTPLGGGVYVDNVSLAVIPEPGSAFLIVAAGAALALWRRRR